MKLSVFTTATAPIARGDSPAPALLCYTEMADEVVVVDGTVQDDINIDKKWFDHLGYYRDLDGKDEEWIEPNLNKIQRCINEWSKEFSWEFIGSQFQRGYEACTGDWVLHCDLDFVFHERDYASIREAFERNPEAPALSFWKYQFILPDRYILKSRLVIAVNKKKYGNRIRFDSGGDLCQPSLDGRELKPEDVPESNIPFYNNEKILQTENQVKDDVGRMARAWHSYFGEYKLGGPDDESAYKEWLHMVLGRINKPHKHIPLSDHPKVMQDTIKNLKPKNWGYNGFGLLAESDYVKLQSKGKSKC